MSAQLRRPFLLATVWLLLVLLIGALGVAPRVPLAIPPLVAALTLGTALYAARASWLRGASEGTFIGFHLWRIPAGIAFLVAGAQGALPTVFTARAGWGDVLAGFLAGAWLLSARTRSLSLGFHLFGLADLLLAVGTGAVLTFQQVPEMGTIAALPFLVIPLFMVPISAASHLVGLARLLAPGRGALVQRPGR